MGGGCPGGGKAETRMKKRARERFYYLWNMYVGRPGRLEELASFLRGVAPRAGCVAKCFLCFPTASRLVPRARRGAGGVLHTLFLAMNKQKMKKRTERSVVGSRRGVRVVITYDKYIFSVSQLYMHTYLPFSTRVQRRV